VHVDSDRAAQAAARGFQGVCGPPAAVPEVLGRILVCDEQDGDGAVRRGRVDADGGLGEVLGGGLGEGLLEGADEVGVGGLEGVLLGVGGGLGGLLVRGRAVRKRLAQRTWEECSTWNDVWLAESK
jgi:hypothetical protein